MRVYLDANFFISGFSDRPKDVAKIKEAADMLDMELWTTRQVFQELRWYLRREVEKIISIDETLNKDIKAFIESIHRPESSLPQPNDMSLILAAKRAKRAKIVSSDMKLLNTIEDLKEETEGIVSSAFVFELTESIDDKKMKKELEKIRERIYAEEVKYSISRSESYDPVARIRIIEDHTLRVLRAIKRPSEELDKKLSHGRPLFVLDFLDDIKAGVPEMFDDFKIGRYEALATEIEVVQNEIEQLLIVSTLTEDHETHDALVSHAADLTLFLYYMEMLCYLYRGTREGVEEALLISDEAFRLLMFAGISNDNLKASVFFVRILLHLIREEFDEIDYYYSLYDSMLDRIGIDEMKETSEGLYISMQIVRQFMGGFSLTKTRLKHPDVTIAMLNDIAKYAIQFDEHENAWQLAVNAYKIGVAYGKEEGALSAFLMLYKVSSSAEDRYAPALEKIAEHALKSFVKKGWETSEITPILNEIQGRTTGILDMTTDSPVTIADLPKELRGWMDVLRLQEIDEKKMLVVRNNEFQARIGIDVSEFPELQNLRTGHRVAFTNGEFQLTNANKETIKDYSVVLIVSPAKGSEISYEGEKGFKYMKVSEPRADNE